MERGILLEKSLKMILELKDEIINSEVIDCGLREPYRVCRRLFYLS